MAETDSRPLLTFVVFTYQQEHLVREAVRGALAQTYSPLEIILSDDASQDRTFEVMQEEVAAYRGPHQIRLNRNPSNLGPARHVNRVFDMVRGELVIVSAGDDISLPGRTAAVYEAWNSTGRTATLIHTRIVHIGERGEPIQHPIWNLPEEPSHRVVEQPAAPSLYVETLQPAVFGCAAAYSPSHFKLFGGLPDDVIHEDNVLTLRTALRGKVLFIDTPLVKYRLHGNNLCNSSHGLAVTRGAIREQEKRMQRGFVNRATMYHAFQKDLAKARELGIVSEEEFVTSTAAARRKQRIYALQASFMTSNVIRKLGTFVRLACAGARPIDLKELSFRLLPGPLFESVKLLRSRLSGSRPSS
jgi:hypothetical protein